MRRFFGKLVSAWCALLIFAPLFLLPGIWWLPEEPMIWWIASGISVTLATVIGFLPGRYRLAGGIAGTISLLLLGGGFLPMGGAWAMMIPCVALYWLILRNAALPPLDEWNSPVLVTGVVLYLVAIVVCRFGGDQRTLGWLRILLLCYVPVFLLLINHQSVSDNVAAQDGRRAPRKIRRGNRLWVALLAAAVLALANLGTLRDAFYAVLGWCGRVLGQVMAWLAALMSTEEEMAASIAGGDAGMMGFLEEVKETPWFLRILEQVFIWLGLIAAVCLLVFALYHLGKALKRWVLRMTAALRRAASQLGEGVQEKTESIFDWEVTRQSVRDRAQSVFRRLRRPPRWRDLDDRQRVRFVYASWLQKRPGTPASWTAREALTASKEDPRMADLYEKARYSQDPVTPEDALSMRDMAAPRRKE